MIAMDRYRVWLPASANETDYETQSEALAEFRECVAEGIPVTVWRVPEGGGESPCIAHFPGTH